MLKMEPGDHFSIISNWNPGTGIRHECNIIAYKEHEILLRNQWTASL